MDNTHEELIRDVTIQLASDLNSGNVSAVALFLSTLDSDKLKSYLPEDPVVKEALTVAKLERKKLAYDFKEIVNDLKEHETLAQNQTDSEYHTGLYSGLSMARVNIETCLERHGFSRPATVENDFTEALQTVYEVKNDT